MYTHIHGLPPTLCTYMLDSELSNASPLSSGHMSDKSTARTETLGIYQVIQYERYIGA